jgi:hypothetical protein
VTIPGTAAPSLTLWRHGGIRRHPARRCASYGRPLAASSSQHTGGERTEDSYAATLEAAPGGYMARHDVPPAARFTRTAIYSTALRAIPSHVARTVRHACKSPSPWPIKGGASSLAAGGRQTTLTHALSTFTTILVLASIKPSGTLRTCFLSRLACSSPVQAPRCNVI